MLKCLIDGLGLASQLRSKIVLPKISCKKYFPMFANLSDISDAIDAFERIGIQPLYDDINGKLYIHFDLLYEDLQKYSDRFIMGDYIVFSYIIAADLDKMAPKNFECFLWNDLTISDRAG